MYETAVSVRETAGTNSDRRPGGLCAFLQQGFLFQYSFYWLDIHLDSPCVMNTRSQLGKDKSQKMKSKATRSSPSIRHLGLCPIRSHLSGEMALRHQTVLLMPKEEEEDKAEGAAAAAIAKTQEGHLHR
jgi:hypothetical protein